MDQQPSPKPKPEVVEPSDLDVSDDSSLSRLPNFGDAGRYADPKISRSPSQRETLFTFRIPPPKETFDRSKSKNSKGIYRTETGMIKMSPSLFRDPNVAVPIAIPSDANADMTQ